MKFIMIINFNKFIENGAPDIQGLHFFYDFDYLLFLEELEPLPELLAFLLLLLLFVLEPLPAL